MKNVINFFILFFFLFSTISSPIISAEVHNSYFLPEKAQKTISMDFKNANLNDVLKVFSQQSGLNFIAAEDVTEKVVTLYLEDVPVQEALERILQANNLSYEIQPESDIFIVKNVAKKTELMTRIYYFKHATVASSKINETIDIDTVSDDDQVSESDDEGEDEENKTGIVAAIQNILSSNGNVTEDPRTNSVIVTDIPSQFPIIERTIARLDIEVPQILIEVEMLDVSKNDADKLGIKYGETPITFSGAARNHLYPFNQNQILEKAKFLFDSDAGSDNGEFSVGTLSAAGMTAIVQFLNTQTSTRNLARPRILTLNNETAEIKIATNEAIGLQTSTDATEGVATQTISAERVETGVFLTVTPQANLRTGEITMAIAPKVIQARTGATFQGQTFRDPEERGTRSILKVNTGDTIVLGGLLRTDSSDIRTKLPFLGNLPFVGGAFRHKDDTLTERELIIFITPKIVNENPSLAKTSESREQQINSELNKYYFSREQDTFESRSEAIQRELSLVEKQGL